MEVYQLIANYKSTHPDGHYFDNETLRFFGERVSEMRVLEKQVVVIDSNNHTHICYVLSSYQHKAPRPGRHYAYFDVNTFDYVY